ncbi:MAG: c-type cytochrome [Bacteroidetes bacterium]|nr:c-type cytochrome [Bacteroidota bacterium]
MIQKIKNFFNFGERLKISIENRNYANYYLVISFILFLATAWAVIDEIITRRPWKDYQIEYQQLLNEKLVAKYDEAISLVDSSYINGLQTDLSATKNILNSEEYQNIFDELNDLQAELIYATREWSFARSKSDAIYYEYNKSLIEGEVNKVAEKKLREIEKEIQNYADSITAVNLRIEEKNKSISEVQNKFTSLTAEIKRAYLEADKLKLKISKVRAQPIEIKQILLDDFERTNFGEVKARVDRCQTCHLGFNEQLMIDAPQPYTTHPLPELLKIHKLEKYGCTTCHRGQGNALTAGFAHGDEDHYWETPLLKKRDVYASCNSCHSNQNALKEAPYFTKAKQVLLEVGCYSCHQIDGYENMEKIGPSLLNVSSKVTPEWTYNWILNPKSYNEHTRMPNPKFTIEEAEAVTSFIINNSKNNSYKSAFPLGFYKGGSVEKGKITFSQVGCKACHVIGDDIKVREARGTQYDIAPELTHVAGKLSPDFIFDWIKNPRHYNPESKMPNLRLSDQEARDVVAYLQTMKENRNPEKHKFNLTDEDKIKFGEKLVKEYGCAGCHNIKGLENEAKVSVNLSNFGRKRVEQMDFGNTPELDKYGKVEFELREGKPYVQHTWEGWVYGKLYNSQLYKTERIPQKMPVFNLGDKEIRMLRMLLMSYRNDKPMEKYQQTYDQRIKDINIGQKLVSNYACISCHILEDAGGYFSSSLEDPAMGPPIITMTGAKVQEPWLNTFLQNPSPVRNWLKVRMPTYKLSENEINDLTKYFLALSKQQLRVRNYKLFEVDKASIVSGKKMFDMLQCLKCHIVGTAVADASSLGPNLELSYSRLKPEWIVDWLKDPQAISPGTMMPGYFPDGQSPLPDMFNGDAKKQMEVIRDHVFLLGKNK